MADILLQETVDLLKQLIKIPSFSSKEEAATDFLEKYLSDKFPGLVSRNGHSLIVDIKSGKPGPTLLLCTHIDTVAVAPNWQHDPFGAATEGDKIYGLGANDAGASLVSMIGALRKSKLQAGRVVLCLAAEEEAGSQGFIRVEPALPRYDNAIFGEPTDMGMATSMRGAMRVTLRSPGVSCHASRPWEGKNAADRFTADLQKLRAINLKDHSPWGCATIEPTIIRGGDSPNQIPGMIETTLDIRTTPDRDNDWIEEQLKKSGVEYTITANRRRPMHNPPDSKIVKTVRKACPQVKDYTFNGTCDMAFATAPSIVMGPGTSERSHVADEYIAVPELARAIDIYAAVVSDYCAG